MEHPEGKTGEIAFDEPIRPGGWLDRHHTDPNGIPLGIGIMPSAAAQERERILNHSVSLRPIPWRESSPGFRALRQLLHGATDGGLDDFSRHVVEVMRDLSGSARGLYDYATGRGEVGGAIAFTRAEQAPNPESRVKLIDEVDRLGLRRIALDWRLSRLDIETMRVANHLLGRELGRLNLGRLRLPEWLEVENQGLANAPLQGGYHHMGTTRMADDPKRGVVDRNCRVHGTQNLYVAGSSVFPTAGFANPTSTIVELALRLADHLKRLA
jgi:choline dehydrogenase-like flavoprotein